MVTRSGCTTETEVLFSESQSRILMEVAPENAPSIESLFAYLPCERVGRVTRGDIISVRGFDGTTVLSMSRIDAKAAWKSTLDF
jgi:phosphoribosylformylglycinamidine synthase